MVVTPHQTDIEGCRKASFEERFMFDDGSHVADAQDRFTCEGERINIANALENWPYHLQNVDKITIEIEHEGQRKILDCESLTSYQRDLIWPGLVDALKWRSRKPLHYGNGACQSTHGEGFGDSQSLETDSEDEAQPPVSGANSHSSASSISDHSPVNNDRNHGASDARKRKRTRLPGLPKAMPAKYNPNEVVFTKLLTIGNETEVSEFLGQCLKEMQQDICKLIAKPWIRAINPNKQTNHPYAKGSEKAPPWWPPTTPVGVEGPIRGKVRHQEPDHLLKDERIILLRHIILIIAQPSAMKQPPMNDIDVARLEQITNVTIGGKLDGEAGRIKRRAVDEFFKLAKQCERLANGEIDGSTLVTVVDFHDQNTDKSPGSRSNGDFRTVEVSDDQYDNSEPISNSVISAAGSATSDGSHIQDFFSARSARNNVSPGVAQYRQQFHTFSTHQPTVGDHLSSTHANGAQTPTPSSLVRMGSNYQAPNHYLQSQPRRASWLSNADSNPSCSPNLTLNSQPVHNNVIPYSSYQDVLQLPVNINVAHTTYLPQSPSMQLPTGNFQPQQGLRDAVQAPRRDSHGCSQGDMNQYSQQLNGFHLLQDQSYGDNNMKENQIRAAGAARAGYAFEHLVDDGSHLSSISRACLPNPNM